MLKRDEERDLSAKGGGGNKSNFTDEFPLLNTATSRINRREQINRVEITKSRGKARRWRVRARGTGTVETLWPLLMAQYLKTAYSWRAVSLLAPAVRAYQSSPLVLVVFPTKSTTFPTPASSASASRYLNAITFNRQSPDFRASGKVAGGVASYRKNPRRQKLCISVSAFSVRQSLWKYRPLRGVQQGDSGL